MFFKKKKKLNTRSPFDTFDATADYFIDTSREHAMIDSLPGVDDSNIDYEYVGKSLDTGRLRLTYALVLFVLIILGGRAFQLQVVQGAEYLNKAEYNRVKLDIVKTNRGLIYDRNGEVLVQNVPRFTLSLIPSALPNNEAEKQRALKAIADDIGISVEQVLDAAYKYTPDSLWYYQPVELVDDISYDQALISRLKQKDFPALVVDTTSLREYQLEGMQSMSHVLGYTGKVSESELEADKKYLLTDYTGKTGLELQYENELRGQHGIQQIEVDALGQEKKILSRDPYQLGNNLHLTIDANAQRFMDESIQEVLSKRPETNRAVGIAMDPQTGEILALSSLPAYDNNKFAQGISSKDFSDLLNDPDKPLFFRAIKGEYPSGSTFKIVMSAATLNEGIIKEYTRFLSNGGIRIGQWFFPDWKDGGHGSTDVRKALAESVNTFYYIIGGGYNDFVGIGARKIAEYARQYGLGEKLGIDLPNEATGFVPTPEWKVEVKDEPWYIGDTYHFSIGQGDLLVTPLQVASFTATVANGGTFYKPHIVKAIEDPNTMKRQEVEPELVRDSIVDEKSTQIVREGLRQGVTNGSGIRLNYLPYSISGKTGTAQWGGDNIPHAWFTSFAPYEKPEIVITVLVEEGEGGTKTAVPIAEQFYKRWLEYKGKIELNTDI